MQHIVDLSFPLSCTNAIPADHGYLLYASISRVLPAVHRENGISVFPIAGRQIGNRQLSLTSRSRLTIRLGAERIPELIELSGQTIQIGDTPLTVGVPQVHALTLATTLRSRLVTIKGYLEEDTFRDAVRRQLDEFCTDTGPEIHTGKRRTIQIKDKAVVGYEVILSELSPENALAVQVHGVGGRRHMGCGVFVPIREIPSEKGGENDA